MKSILVADNRSDQIETLEPILKHWGYRVLSTGKVDQAITFLQESEPCLLIIGEELLADPALKLTPETTHKIETGEIYIVALQQDDAGKAQLIPSETLTAPVDLFELFSFIQKQVERHPRKNLRLRLKLPGMYSIDDEAYILADVLSLSAEGLFFKAQAKVGVGERINVVFPLFGHCKEIEIEATVCYTVQPDADNNFSQGFGVSFENISEQHREPLQEYIREHFLKEVSTSIDGVSDFEANKLR
jgi:CheY-like chemotaxis protein